MPSSVRCAMLLFQSTLPGWGATVVLVAFGLDGDISIHAPRMGSDYGTRYNTAYSLLFQSTLPGWGATGRILGHGFSVGFQSTLPGWGATGVLHRPIAGRTSISIHAPRMGSDRENGHLRPRYGQNHPFSTLIVSQIVIDVLGTVRKSQKHQRTSHYEVIKQPERRK